MKYSSAGQVISITLPLNQFIEYWNKNDTTSLLDGNGIYEVFFKVILLAAKNHFKLLISTYINKNQYEVTCTVGVWSKINPILIANVDDNNKSSLTLSGNLIVDGTINGTASSADFILNNNASLGYRQRNKSYSLGDITYHSSLPTGYYLECTTAGTSGSSELTISSPSIGGTVSDGTVVWRISMALSVNGGSLAGNIMCQTNDSQLLFLAGTAWKKGACLRLFGNDYVNAANDARKFIIDVFDENGNSVELKGAPDKTLVWAGNDLAGSAIVAKSLFDYNGYIKYASGLIIQWGRALWESAAWQSRTVTFPISFNSKTSYSAVACALTPNTSDAIAVGLDNVSASTMQVYKATATQSGVYWLAIGY